MTPAFPQRPQPLLVLALVSALAFFSGCGGGSSSPSPEPPSSISAISVSVAPTAASVLTGQTQNFTATVANDNQSKGVTWALSGAGCTAAACGTLSSTTSTSGAAIIYTAPPTVPNPATVALTSTSVADATKSAAAAITLVAPTLKSVAITPANPSVALGLTQQFTATGTFSDGSKQNLTNSVKWSTSNTTATTISPSGLALGLVTGSATIQAASGSITGSTTLVVSTAALSSIAVTPSTPTIAQGVTQQFTATGTYTDGSIQDVTTSVTWSSSDKSIATISSGGLVTGVASGPATIQATYQSETGSTTLTVSSATLSSIAVTPSNASIAQGLSEQFKATGTYSDGSTHDLTTAVTWSSLNKTIATIASGGLAKAVAVGTATIQAQAPLGSTNGTTTLTVNTANASQQGQWQTLPYTMPINPIHMSLLHNGKVLVVAGSGNQLGITDFKAAVWNLQTGTITTQPVDFDMFCNGMVILPDGKAFIFGGTVSYDPFVGAKNAETFDPATGSFTDQPSMAHGRWYPTGTVLSDGRVMVFSGLDENSKTNTQVEIFTEGSGWGTPVTAGWTPPSYPRMHVLPNGKVFFSGSSPTTRLFDPSSMTWTTVAVTNYDQTRTYGSSVLLPLTPANGYKPQVIIMGGGSPGTPATATTEIIDLSAGSPSWAWGPSMSQPRIDMNATLLPTGKILVTAGSTVDEDATSASLNADLYDPASNKFSSAGANAFARLYHSEAMLLPDATVMVAGGNPSRGVYEKHLEIYSPAYLFNSDGSAATRPTITNVPSNVSYGNNFQIATPDANNISSVVVIRASAVTHSFDMDQRLVGLNFSNGGRSSLTATAPPNGSIAPPGYYLLFLVNKNGVPSVGAFVQITN